MKEHVHSSNHNCIADTDIGKIIKVAGIIFIFMLIELWGHFRTNSLSLLADVLHLLVDISGFVVSILTLYVAKKPPSSKMTFGYQRIEILGALLSVAFIWAAVLYLMVESIHKYMHPLEIDGSMFVRIAVIGLLVNLLCMYILHRDPYPHTVKESNLNIRATYVHLLGDVIQSAGVIIASLIIYFYPAFVVVDIICTVFFALLVLFSTVYILCDALRILAEGAPGNISQDGIKEYLMKKDAVIKIEELRVWSVSVGKHAVMMKILVDHILIGEYEKLLVEIEKYLREMGIEIVAIQLNTPNTTGYGVGFTIV